MNTQSPPTTLSEERLLPCPFCGKQPTSEFCSVGVPGMEDCGYWGIDCTCGMSQVHADDEEFAIEKWNNRHAAEQMARYQWQPIESAPKKELISIWIVGTNAQGERWCEGPGEVWISSYYDTICDEWRTLDHSGRMHHVPARFVTHWKPSDKGPKAVLPPAPEKGGAA